MVRLFIGGLAADTTPALLAPRFTPFGEVLGCDVVPAKPHSSPSEPPAPCRGFAYVSLNPKDDAALRRCLSAYNGCKWRGGVLKVDVAKPDYSARLAAEWQAQAEADAREAAIRAAEEEQGARVQHVLPAKSGATMRMPRREGKKMMTVDFSKPRGSRDIFPPARPRPPVWDDVPAPAHSRAYQLQQTAAWEPPPWTETPQLPAGRHAIAERGDPPGWDLHQLLGQAQPADEQRAAERVDVKAHKAARAKVKQPVLVDPESSDEPEAAVVEFHLDDDVQLPGQHCATSTRLQAFDSDSDDPAFESNAAASLPSAAMAERTPVGMMAMAAQTAARPSVAPAPATSSNDEASAGEESDGPASKDSSEKGLPMDSCGNADGEDRVLMPPSSDSSIQSDEGPAATVVSMSQQQQQQQTGGSSSSSSEGAAMTSEHSPERSDPVEPTAASASDSAGSLHSNGDAKASSEWQAEAVGGYDSAGERRRESSEESSSADADSGAVSGNGDDEGSDQEAEGLAAPSAGELDADADATNGVETTAMDRVEDDVPVIPAGLESLTVGAQFWAGAEDPRAAEADWLARRGPLAADWRAKRRAALKHSRTHRKKPRR